MGAYSTLKGDVNHPSISTMTEWIQVQCTIVQGHQIASGQANDPQFPGGTLRMQHAAFAQRGLDLSGYFPGTLNLSIHPHCYEVKQSVHTFRNVTWADHRPPEDFSFFDCRVIQTGQKAMSAQKVSTHAGLIYYPHPDTKPMHFQSSDILEVLMPFIDGLNYGDTVLLELNSTQIRILGNAIARVGCLRAGIDDALLNI